MRRFAFVVSASLLVLALGTAFAQSPGGSSAFGKTLGEWMVMDAAWRMGGDQENPAGKMVFLPDITDVPDEDGEWVYDEDRDVAGFFGAMDVSLKTDQKFSMPLFGLNGELYEDGSEDAPDDPDYLAVVQSAFINVWIDGKLVIDSEADDYEDYWYGPMYFDEPILYDEATYYGAIGVVFTEGYGFVHPPLSKGSHTIVLYLYMADWGYEHELTLNVTVGK